MVRSSSRGKTGHNHVHRTKGHYHMAKKGMIAEFKEFIFTGDLINIAVAFIMGAAVKAVIDSFVGNVVLGLISMVLPKDVARFGDLAIGTEKFGPDPTDKTKQISLGKPLKYGQFIDDFIKFVILAFVVFMLIKAYKKATGKTDEAPAPGTNDLLGEIRDLLKTGR
jgi:large conductance mechanosensitive channel